MRNFAFAVLLLAASLPATGASYDDLNAGIQLYSTKNWTAAIAALDKALAANDLAPGLQYVAHLDRGIAHLARDEPAPAIADFDASLGLRPGDPAVLLRRSSAYFDGGKLDQAAADLDQVIASHPYLTFVIIRRALVNAQRGLAAKSTEDLNTARAQLPNGADYYRSFGIIEWQAGQPRAAEASFANALEKDSRDIYAWMWLTLTEFRLGKDVPRKSLPDFDHKKWPEPIVEFFLGARAQDAVFTAASASAPGSLEDVNGQTCEANFYVGEWLLQHHDAAAAKPLIQKTASDCPRSFVEWQPAQSEWKNLQ